MRTVKEISDLTGISVRTLHYYDEIGLLKPTDKSEAGYRLYDDKALETLQQILFFREFDIPLKEIKAVMENPALEKHQILKMQREMLMAKKERLESLIASIDRILKGENRMDFEVFSKNELEDMYNAMEANMSEVQKNIFIKHYGSKEKALEASKNPANPEIFPAYQKRLGTIIKKLADLKGKDVNSFEVRELVGEYDFVTKQMFQLPDVTDMVLEIADAYRTNPEIQAAQDSVYGEGTTEFIGQAMEAFYGKP